MVKIQFERPERLSGSSGKALFLLPDRDEEMLEATDIRKVWETVRPGLEEIRAEMRADWRPEDLYAMCVNGQATLYTDPGASRGFVVVSRLQNEFTGEPYLYVHAAWAPGERVGEVYLPQIEEIARKAGARFIEILSPRRGFERTGWNLEHVCYRRRV